MEPPKVLFKIKSDKQRKELADLVANIDESGMDPEEIVQWGTSLQMTIDQYDLSKEQAGKIESGRARAATVGPVDAEGLPPYVDPFRDPGRALTDEGDAVRVAKTGLGRGLYEMSERAIRGEEVPMLTPAQEELPALSPVAPSMELPKSEDRPNLSGLTDEPFNRPISNVPEGTTGLDALGNKMNTHLYYEPSTEEVAAFWNSHPELAQRHLKGVAGGSDQHFEALEEFSEVYKRGADLMWAATLDEANRNGVLVTRWDLVPKDKLSSLERGLGEWVMPGIKLGAEAVLNFDRGRTGGLVTRMVGDAAYMNPDEMAMIRDQAPEGMKLAGQTLGAIGPGSVPSRLLGAAQKGMGMPLVQAGARTSARASAELPGLAQRLLGSGLAGAAVGGGDQALRNVADARSFSELQNVGEGVDTSMMFGLGAGVLGEGIGMGAHKLSRWLDAGDPKYLDYAAGGGKVGMFKHTVADEMDDFIKDAVERRRAQIPVGKFDKPEELAVNSIERRVYEQATGSWQAAKRMEKAANAPIKAAPVGKALRQLIDEGVAKPSELGEIVRATHGIKAVSRLDPIQGKGFTIKADDARRLFGEEWVEKAAARVPGQEGLMADPSKMVFVATPKDIRPKDARTLVEKLRKLRGNEADESLDGLIGTLETELAKRPTPTQAGEAVRSAERVAGPLGLSGEPASYAEADWKKLDELRRIMLAHGSGKLPQVEQHALEEVIRDAGLKNEAAQIRALLASRGNEVDKLSDVRGTVSQHGLQLWQGMKELAGGVGRGIYPSAVRLGTDVGASTPLPKLSDKMLDAIMKVRGGALARAATTENAEDRITHAEALQMILDASEVIEEYEKDER